MSLKVLVIGGNTHQMEYQTHIFEENKKKIRSNRKEGLIVAGFAILSISTFLIGPLFGAISTISSVVTLVKLHNNDLKKKGIRAYGQLKANLTIAEEYLIIDETKIPFSELQSLTIYVDEYTGMTKDVFWSYHGGNNELIFSHKNQQTSFTYLIRNHEDYKLVERLVDNIETKYPKLLEL